jgi:hypothetical protein
VVSHHDVVRDTTESGLLGMVSVLAAAMPLAALVQALVNAHDYRQPAVVWVVWLAVLAAAAHLVPRWHGTDLGRGESLAAVLIAIAAVAAVGWEYRPHSPARSVDLAVLGTVWLLALVALSHPVRFWIPGAVAVFAVHTALLLRAAGANSLGLAQLEAAGYVLVTILIAFTALRPTLAMHADMTARSAWLASRSVAERAAAAAVQEERRSRLALLEVEALPLLRGIADGALDPATAPVRERCARHAAVLRDSLTRRAAGTGGLTAALEPVLRAASARGMLVNVQVIGDPGVTGARVAHAVSATVGAVAGALAPHQVMLTIVGSGDGVELYLTFSEPLRFTPDVARFGRELPAAACWRAAVSTEETGAGCLEINWRKAVPQ